MFGKYSKNVVCPFLRMRLRITVSDVPRTIFANAAGRSLDMMIRQQLIPICAKNGFLMA
jgi:hypothetical protein